MFILTAAPPEQTSEIGKSWARRPMSRDLLGVIGKPMAPAAVLFDRMPTSQND